MNLPLTTAVCLTKNRRQWLPRAIECFKSQTYLNKELLICADGEDVSDLIPADDNIRLVATHPMTIGLKRNFANKHANGELICHWDDDDFSAPERLADQVSRLLESGKAVSAYCSVVFSGDKGRYKYFGIPNVNGIGTSLCYRKDWWEAHPFPDMHVSEDNAFAMTAAQARQLISVDGGEMIIASIHPGNTSPRQLTGAQWVKL